MSDSTNEAPPVDRSPKYSPAWPAAVEIFDTTLRDGVQFEGISVNADDKLKVARKLDELGVHYIEGGYPAANPKDEEFFARAKTELDLTTARLVAFGSTRRPMGKVDQDATLEVVANSGAGVACIVGKTWDYHVEHALRTTLDEAVAMVGDSVKFLKDQGLDVFFDGEHFFDGFKRNPEFALRVMEAAAVNGADALVLCDTNGGTLPHEIGPIVAQMVRHFDGISIGMHTQNDTGCATANAIAGVVNGATQVQVTMNGYGERTGNCDITQLVPNLSLKMGIQTLPEASMANLSNVSHSIAELMNMPQQHQLPYVGSSAFAHKAGLHTSAIARRPDSYEHVDPASVGNGTRLLVGDLSGRATIDLKMREYGLELDKAQIGAVVETMKRLEHEGYHFEVAEASLELLLRGAAGWEHDFFQLESFRVNTEHRSGAGARAWNDVAVDMETEATVKLLVDGVRIIATGEGNGPVNALHAALAAAISGRYPAFETIKLTDFKVRVLSAGEGTGAVTRVLIESTNGSTRWTTIGVSENIVEASWQALIDSIVFGLMLTEDES
ncbi:MAG: citramalate synthase [Acidimicrobiales bacterium]